MPFVAAAAAGAAFASFAAPAAVAALGVTSTFATAAVTIGGSALVGGATSRLMGGSFTEGALGGASGGFLGAGGMAGLGLTGGAAAAGAPGAAAASGSAMAPMMSPLPLANPGLAAAAPAAATVTAPTGLSLGGLASSVGGQLAGSMTPDRLLQLAMTVYGRPPQQLTAQERAALQDTARISSDNQGLFERQLDRTQSLWQEGAANPQRAFADAQIGINRQLQDARRGASPDEAAFMSRQAAISGSRMGSAAVSDEHVRSAGLRSAAASMAPASSPQGFAGMALPIYENLEQRRQGYRGDLARVAGGLFAPPEEMGTA